MSFLKSCPFELSVFRAYGDCNTIDGVSVGSEDGVLGGYIATRVGQYPRGVREIKIDTNLKEIGDLKAMKG